MEQMFPKIRPGVEALPIFQGGREAILLRDRMGISPDMVLDRSAGLILALMDGRNDLRDIQVALMRKGGLGLIGMDQIEEFVKTLDNNYFLDNERYWSQRREVTRAFRENPLRVAAHAGSAYPADAGELRSLLGSLLQKAGSGNQLPQIAPSGLVLPHIDLTRGGECYAWGYKALEPFVHQVDLFVILGTSHVPMDRPWAMTSKIFETPLGRVDSAADLAQKFCELAGEDFFWDELAHRTEHTIEIQLVFLQYLAQKASKSFRVLPILCSGYHELMDGRLLPSSSSSLTRGFAALKRLLAETPEGVCVIASADLSHLGPQFGDPRPLEVSDLPSIAREDMEMLQWVTKGNPDGFYRHIMAERDRRRICGLPPIYAWLTLMEGKSIKLIKYSQAYHPYCTVTFASIGAW